LSSALADIEETTSQDPVAPDYTQHALPRESTIHFLVDNYDGLKGDGATAYYGESVGSVFIPDAVWNIDGSISTVTYLYNISDWPSLSLSNHYDTSRSWSLFSLSTTGNQDIVPDSLNLSSSQFQVASCLETISLGYCNATNNSENKHASNAQRGIQDNDSDSVTSPNVPSPPTQNQPNTFYGPSLTPASVTDFLLQGASLMTIQDLCDDIYVICAATQVKPPTSPSDSPIWSIDSPTAITIDLPELPDVPPDQVINYVDNSAPVSDPLPLSTQPLATTPVPEISTEIMAIIGFFTMALSYKRKALRSIRQGVARTFYKALRTLFIAKLRRDPSCDNIGQ
jgi:hypothetical protein